MYKHKVFKCVFDMFIFLLILNTWFAIVLKRRGNKFKLLLLTASGLIRTFSWTEIWQLHILSRK